MIPNVLFIEFLITFWVIIGIGVRSMLLHILAYVPVKGLFIIRLRQRAIKKSFIFTYPITLFWFIFN